MDVIENPKIHNFGIYIMSLPRCDHETEGERAHDILKSGVLKSLCDSIILTRKMYFHENDSIKGLLGDRLLNMRSLNSGFKTTCTEVYAIAVFDILYSLVSVFIDEHNRTIEVGSGHFCDTHGLLKVRSQHLMTDLTIHNLYLSQHLCRSPRPFS